MAQAIWKSDLERARERLEEGGLGLVIVRHERVLWESDAPGVKSLLAAATDEGSLDGAVLADRVVGRAVALVAQYAGLVAVHGHVMSDAGIARLVAFGTVASYDLRVPRIQNRAGTEMCPLERLIMPIASPTAAVAALRQFTAGGRQVDQVRKGDVRASLG